MISGKAGFLRLEKGRVEGYGMSHEIPLGTDVTIIGRPRTPEDSEKNTADVRIRDDYISRGHATIRYSFETGAFLLQERDTGTKNGTFLNGERIEPGRPYPLEDGDFVGLAKIGGEFRVVFRFRENAATLVDDQMPAVVPSSGLSIDIRARRVLMNGTEIPLRRKEFDLLAFLYVNRGKACSKNEIAEGVWVEEGGIVSQETIDTDVFRIRQRIEPDPSHPRHVVTLPSYGYRLDM
jgi:hypothetical protein